MITPVGFVDTSMFTAIFVTKHKKLLSAAEGQSLRTLPLLHQGQPTLVMEDWKSGRNLLQRIKAAVTGDDPVQFGDVAVMQLDPGGYLPWADDAQEGRRLHLCLVPSPGCWIYSGGAGAVIPVGQLTEVDHRILYSVVNFGEYPCTHLVLDVKAG